MGKRIILIKSGGEAVRSAIKRMLERQGHKVVAVAGNQIEAVEVLGEEGIEADLVVTGLLLYQHIGDTTRVNAYELAEYFRRRGLPVVIHSTEEPQRSDWPEDMLVAVVEDPWDPESLSTAIESTGKPR